MTAALGPVGWLILALTALVAIVVVAITSLTESYNANTIAAEAAAESA